MDRVDFSDEDKRKCAEREVAMRKAVYGNRVRDGRMRKDEAEREIAIMEAIARDYTKIEQEEISF